MKAKQKTLGILLVLILLAGAALAFVVNANTQAEQAASAAEEGTIPLSSFAVEDLTQIQYTYQEETLLLNYDGENWTLADDPDYHLNQTLCNSMAAALCDFNAKRQLTAEEGESYGTESPLLTVQVTAAGQTNRFTFGDTNPVTGDIYLQKEGDTAIYTASSSKAECFEYTKEALFESFNPTGLSSSELEQVEYTVSEGGQSYTVCLQAVSQPVEEDAADSTESAESDAVEYTTVWRLTSEPDAVLDETVLDQIFSSLTSYVSGQITGAALADYGLDAPAVTVRATTSDTVVNLRYSIAEDGCYLWVEGDDSIYRVDLTTVQNLCRTPAELTGTANTETASES